MKTEQETRTELIDKLLLKAGWNVNDPTQGIRGIINSDKINEILELTEQLVA